MASKSLQRREKLFNIFSSNLSVIKTHPSIKFTPDFEEGYICPICFKLFDWNALQGYGENPLTLEDIPPKSLGGNPKALTCRKCNSFCGHQIDNHLLRRLEGMDFREMLPNAQLRTSFIVNGSVVNGTTGFEENRGFDFNLMPEISNPAMMEEFMQGIFPPRYFKPDFNPLTKKINELKPYKTNKFNVNWKDKSIERNSIISLLKTAYLFAFSCFGNAFLINHGLAKVREQILNPHKEILPPVLGINYELSEKFIGLNLITEPKELRSFLIVFNLTTKSKTRQFAIVLPGFSDPGISVYNNLDELLGNKKIDITIRHLPMKEYVKNLDQAWDCHRFWNRYCLD